MDQFELLFMISMITDHVDLNMGLLEHTCIFMLVYTLIIWLSSVPLHCSSSPFPKNVFPVLQCYRKFCVWTPQEDTKNSQVWSWEIPMEHPIGDTSTKTLWEGTDDCCFIRSRNNNLFFTTVIFHRKQHRWSELENQLNQKK